MNKSEKAKALFKEGYNCAQAVVGAYADELGLDMETAMKLSSSFGGGMGRLREVCGAVSGMFMVAGLKYGYSSPEAKLEKTEHYKKIQELACEFKNINCSIICRELLGLQGENKHKPHSCEELVGDAAGILEKFINKNS